MVNLYRVGSVIEYHSFGSEYARRVVVESKETDVKNGRPGFDGLLVDGTLAVWGYDDQISRVITY